MGVLKKNRENAARRENFGACFQKKSRFGRILQNIKCFEKLLTKRNHNIIFRLGKEAPSRSRRRRRSFPRNSQSLSRVEKSSQRRRSRARRSRTFKSSSARRC